MQKIAVIAGSIREKSYNRAVARYLSSLSSEDTQISVVEISTLPFFSEDLEVNLPAEVQKYIDEIVASDAVIICTPEYNNMVPGVLKNACEWLTRGYSKHAVSGKPLAIVGASTGGFGTVRAQNQMMLLGLIMGMIVSSDLRFPISGAQDKIDQNGNLHDAECKEGLSGVVEKLKSRIPAK